MTLSQQAPLVERLKSSAEAFRRYPVYTVDGDAVKLTVQADEAEEAAARITELEGFAQGWHRAVETILTIAGLSPALGAVEAVEAMRERLAPAEPSGWRPIERLKSWQGGMETEGPNAGEFTASMVFANHADCVSFIQFCASLPLPPTSEGGGA